MDTNLLCRFLRLMVEKTPAATICLTWARFVGGKIEEEMSVLVSVVYDDNVWSMITWSMMIIEEMNAPTIPFSCRMAADKILRK